MFSEFQSKIDAILCPEHFGRIFGWWKTTLEIEAHSEQYKKRELNWLRSKRMNQHQHTPNNRVGKKIYWPVHRAI